MCSYTRSTGRNFHTMCDSCGHGVAASIAGAPMGRGCSIFEMDDSGTGNGIAGATAKVDACDGRQRTSCCTVPGPPVVLACAHLNHDPSDSALHRLAALCQRCHMILDGPEHRRRSWRNAHYRRALGDLFYGPYPLWGAEWITPTPLSMLDSGSAF